MKHLISPLILATSLFTIQGLSQAQAVGSPSPTDVSAKAPKLSRVDVDALLAKPEQVVILDVRRPDELTAIGGFPVYLSIQSKELEKNLAYIPRDRAIVTVSNHAGRAQAAAVLLASKGFKVAGAIGAQDYEAQGGSLSKIAPPAPKPGATVPVAQSQ